MKRFSYTYIYILASIFCFTQTAQLQSSSDHLDFPLDDSDFGLFEEEPLTWREYYLEKVDQLQALTYLVQKYLEKNATLLKKKPLVFARKHRLPLSGLGGSAAAIAAYLLLKEQGATTKFGGSAVSGIGTAALLYWLLSKPNKEKSKTKRPPQKPVLREELEAAEARAT